MSFGDPQPCRCGQYHMLETASAVVRVPCPYGWDSLPHPAAGFTISSHCPGCRCDEEKDTPDEETA